MSGLPFYHELIRGRTICRFKHTLGTRAELRDEHGQPGQH
jgi:hypothetical protein